MKKLLRKLVFWMLDLQEYWEYPKKGLGGPERKYVATKGYVKECADDYTNQENNDKMKYAIQNALYNARYDENGIFNKIGLLENENFRKLLMKKAGKLKKKK